MKGFKHVLSLHFSIQNSTFENIAMPKLSKKLPEYLTQNEATILFEYLHQLFQEGSLVQQRDAFIVMLLYVTGMRISELIILKRGSIKNGYIQVIGKGDKERMVPIPNEFQEVLEMYLSILTKNQQFLFLRISKKKVILEKNLTRGYVYKKVITIMRHIFPNKQLSPHSLRHSIATHLLNKGMDMRSLQAFLGHQKISTVALYTHLDIKRLKSGYQDFHPRSEMKSNLQDELKDSVNNTKK